VFAFCIASQNELLGITLAAVLYIIDIIRGIQNK